MIFYIGPLVLGFLLGFILGTRVKTSPESKLKFTTEVYIIIFVTAILVAYFVGAFPYYADVPLASGFVAAAIGLMIGKLIFGREKREKTGIS